MKLITNKDKLGFLEVEKASITMLNIHIHNEYNVQFSYLANVHLGIHSFLSI